MKALLISLSFLVATPAFANCVSEMMAGAAQGNLDLAQRLCRHAEKTCDLKAILLKHPGMNYAQAMELCARQLKSNADVIECISKGYNYSSCENN